MRDVNRIEPFCNEFAELWKNYPYLRFGQIMCNIEKYCQITLGKDMFYMEDDELMEVIRHQLRNNNRIMGKDFDRFIIAKKITRILDDKLNTYWCNCPTCGKSLGWIHTVKQNYCSEQF